MLLRLLEWLKITVANLAFEGARLLLSRMISVLMPSYNASAYIADAIGSVLSQDSQDFEIIVQDAGSKDGTEGIVRSFADDRIRFDREADRGQSHALNLAMEKARGDWVVWLNADDLLCEGALSAAAEQFDSGSELIFGDFAIIDSGGNRLKSYKSSILSHSRFLTNGCYVFSGSVFWQKSVLAKIGGFDESLHYAMDLDIFLRATGVQRPLHIDRELSQFRRHSGAKTTDSPWPMFREDLQVRFRNCRSPVDLLLAFAGQVKLAAYISTRSVWHSEAWRRLRPSKVL